MNFSFRLCFSLLTVSFLLGCASTNQEHITYPSNTPFDANAGARMAYMDGFRTGYRTIAYNDRTLIDTLPGPWQNERKAGFRAGVGQARFERKDVPAQPAGK